MERAHSEPFDTSRALVDFINNRGILRGNIVTILQMNNQLFLIYYQ